MPDSRRTSTVCRARPTGWRAPPGSRSENAAPVVAAPTQLDRPAVGTQPRRRSPRWPGAGCGARAVLASVVLVRRPRKTLDTLGQLLLLCAVVATAAATALSYGLQAAADDLQSQARIAS